MALVEDDLHKELLSAINEIFQVMLLTKAGKENSDFEISLNIIKKNAANQKDISLFSIKVACNLNIPLLSLIKGQCMPHVSKLVYCMQTFEKESHLAIQSMDENNDRKINTVLWIEPNNITNDSVKIMSQHVSLAKRKDHKQSAIQLRIFNSISSVCACSVEICDLMGCFKMMNPKVQFKFKMDFGGLVEFQLCNTSSVRIEHYNICIGLDILNRKLLESFNTGKMVFHCSHQRKMKQTSEDDLSIFISCIVCYVPLLATTDQHLESNHSKEYTPGSIKIQVFGPHGFPLNISNIIHAMPLDPQIFLPWSDFGFCVKRKFISSTYSLECAARQQFQAESQVGTKCDRFIIIINFMVGYQQASVHKENEDSLNIKDEIDLLEILEKVCESNDASSIYQEVAMSCLDVLFIHNKKTKKKDQLSIQNDQKIDGAVLCQQLVPDVVSSLIDIFSRSANTEFRSEVALLIPTDSRQSISNYLETKLMGIIQNPSSSSASAVCPVISGAHLLDPTTQNLLQPTSNEEEECIDDWNFTTNTYIDKMIHPNAVMITNSDNNLQCRPRLPDLFIDEANSLPPRQISKTNRNNENTSVNISLDNFKYYKYPCNKTVKDIMNPKDKEINNSDDKKDAFDENLKDLSELIAPFDENTQLKSDFSSEPIKGLNQQLMHSMQLTLNGADSYRLNLFIPSVSSYGHLSVENKAASSKSNIDLDDAPRKRVLFCEDLTTQDTARQHNDTNKSRNYSKKIKIATNSAEVINLDQTLEVNKQTIFETEEASLQITSNVCLSHISKQDEEKDWFDESEVEKWFAEMEN